FTSSAHRSIERYQDLKLILAMPKIPAFDRREASCRRSTIAYSDPGLRPGGPQRPKETASEDNPSSRIYEINNLHAKTVIKY
ncbi:hypothetical protein ACCS96_23975, partial [Rhizobium ruizarguesonis]